MLYAIPVAIRFATGNIAIPILDFPGYYQLVTWSGTSYVISTIIEHGKGYWALVLLPTRITVG